MNHRWSDPVRFPFKTERHCIREGCPIVKVTRHEPAEPAWREWWREGERLPDGPTPACAGRADAPRPEAAA